MENKLISIVIPCYNGEKTIIQCVDSVKKAIIYLKKTIKTEIIVIDDGSTDNTSHILNSQPDIRVIMHSKNKGLSSARNSGINIATGDYLVFLDCDIIVEESWLLNMLDFLNQDEKIMGAIGVLRPQKNNSLSGLESYLFSSYRGSKKTGLHHFLDYRFFVFSNTIIKKEALGGVGLFDEKLKNYGGEDTEMAIRFHQKHPKTMRQNEKACAYHSVNKSLKEYLKNMEDYGKYNFPQIINKHPQYRKDLGYNFITSFYGYLLFNSFCLVKISVLSRFINHPLITKFLVVASFVRGARKALRESR